MWTEKCAGNHRKVVGLFGAPLSKVSWCEWETKLLLFQTKDCLLFAKIICYQRHDPDCVPDGSENLHYRQRCGLRYLYIFCRFFCNLSLFFPFPLVRNEKLAALLAIQLFAPSPKLKQLRNLLRNLWIKKRRSINYFCLFLLLVRTMKLLNQITFEWTKPSWQHRQREQERDRERESGTLEPWIRIFALFSICYPHNALKRKIEELIVT